MTAAEAISGLELSERYYSEIVRPILTNHYPGLKYSTALIGAGSEVLGFDDNTSRDHHWGPRFILFLTDTDHANLSSAIDNSLRQNLPPNFLGYSTNFSDVDRVGVRLLKPDTAGDISHFVEIVTIKKFFDDLLGIDIHQDPSYLDWLGFPQQILLSVQSGRIFHDQLGLEKARDRLRYYPDNIRLYMIASSWQRIGQEEHLAGRALLTGQDIGFSVIASRLVRDIMQLGFLLERKYAPFAKWLEKSFAELDCGPTLMPSLTKTISSASLQARQQNLYSAFEILASIQNDLVLTKPVNSECRPFHGRPFKAIHGGEIAEVVADSIDDVAMQAFIRRGLIGNIDQISDSTEILASRLLRQRLIQSVFV